VRNTAAGMRYVLYLFLCDLNIPPRSSRRPGHFMAPKAKNASATCRTWCSPMLGGPSEWRVFIYYGSSDTRTQVATTTVEKLLDYVANTPPDAMRSKLCVDQRCRLIEKNLRLAR